MRKVMAVFALLALCGCVIESGSDRAHERTQKTFSAAGISSLQLKDTAGTVRIEAWSKPQIEIDSTKDAPDEDALKRIHVEIVRNGSTLEVSSKYDSSFGVSRGGVSYRIMLPAATNVEVNNIAGTIEAKGLTANLKAVTKAGTIDARMAKLTGDQQVELSATTGTVDLTIPKTSDASVDASSKIGSLDSDFASVSGSRQHLVGEGGHGKIGSGSASVKLSTTTGTIGLHAAG